MTDVQAVDRMAVEVERQLGPVDLLVSNAGVFHPIGPAWETDPEVWWRCIDVNLRGPFLCSRAVLPGMVARHRGRIVTVASGAGIEPWRNVAAYATAKCAAIRFSENLAAETRKHGVSVFSMNPQVVRTALTEDVAGSRSDEKWLGGQVRKWFEDGDDVPPERAAQLVLFLASGKADALSGCYFDVHYDMSELVQRAEEIQRKNLYTLRLRT